MECTHVCHQWCRTNVALMMTSINNPLFSSNCTTWLIDVHPTWSEEIFFKCYTSLCLICNSTICSGMWDDKLCKYISYQYPSATFVYNGCFVKTGSWWMRWQGIRWQNALISVSITVVGENASWVLNAHSTKVSSLKSWFRNFRSFS